MKSRLHFSKFKFLNNSWLLLVGPHNTYFFIVLCNVSCLKWFIYDIHCEWGRYGHFLFWRWWKLHYNYNSIQVSFSESKICRLFKIFLDSRTYQILLIIGLLSFILPNTKSIRTLKKKTNQPYSRNTIEISDIPTKIVEFIKVCTIIFHFETHKSIENLLI